MKKIVCAALAAIALVATSCSPMVGMIYTDTVVPGAATSNTTGSKVGMAQRSSILGLVCTGDGGIQAAAKAAGIKKISHVDVKEFSVLGIYSTATTVVYGE